MGKHLEKALPSVYTLQCLTGKVDNNIREVQAQTRALVRSARPFVFEGAGAARPYCHAVS